MAWRISCPRCQHEVVTREAGAFVLLCPQCGCASDVEAAEATDAPHAQRSELPIPPPLPANPWYAFGAGARLLTIGYVIELVTLVLLGLTLLAYLRIMTELHAVAAVLTVGFLFSSAFVARGRTMQMS